MEAASVPQPTAPPGRRAVEFIGAQICGSCSAGFFWCSWSWTRSRTLNHVVDGLSIGSIWALIALGYTLVYGIIELINFAHGEVFMIGSFVSVSLYATFGIDRADRRVPRGRRSLVASSRSRSSGWALNVSRTGRCATRRSWRR